MLQSSTSAARVSAAARRLWRTGVRNAWLQAKEFANGVRGGSGFGAKLLRMIRSFLPRLSVRGHPETRPAPVRATKLRVLIPTTSGLVEVQRLIEEDPGIGRSVVCIGGTAQVADINGAYEPFVARSTGVVARLFGHPCYRLDVSGRIDAGSSWQLGVLTAHALRAAGRLAGEHDAADGVVWATGSVRSVDLAVAAVSHVGEKLALSLDRLRGETLARRGVVVALPAANAADIDPEISVKLGSLGISVVEVAAVEALWNRLDLSPVAMREQREQRRQLRVRTAIAASMAALAFVAAAAAWTALRQSLEAELREEIAVKAAADSLETVIDFQDRLGVTAPETTRRLEEIRATLKRLSSPQAQEINISSLNRALKGLFASAGASPELLHVVARELIASSENYQKRGMTAKQLADAAEARKILSSLAGRPNADPRWQRDLGRAWMAEGDALRLQGRGADALAAYEASLALAPKEPQDPDGLKHRASSLARVGDVLADRGDYDRAMKNFNETLQLHRRRAAMEANQPKWRLDVAAAHLKVGDALWSRRDISGALASFRESERITRELVAVEPKNTLWLRELSVSKERIGDILLSRSDFPGALAAYQESMDLREKLAASDPGTVQPQIDLVFAHSKIADAVGRSRSDDDLRRALAIRQKGHALIAAIKSGSETSFEVRRALFASHLRLGDNFTDLRDGKAAANQYQAALDQAEYLADFDPNRTEWRDFLAVALDRLGDRLRARGEFDAALAKLDQAGGIRADLVALDPGRKNWRRSLAMVEITKSVVLERRGDLNGAVRLTRDALRVVEEIADTYPEPFADIHIRIVTLLGDKGDRDGELKALQAGRSALQRIVAANPSNPALMERLVWFEKTYRERAGGSK